MWGGGGGGRLADQIPIESKSEVIDIKIVSILSNKEKKYQTPLYMLQ